MQKDKVIVNKHCIVCNRISNLALCNHCLVKKIKLEMKKLHNYKDALKRIEENHFECDGGEACQAHNIAKKTLLKNK